MLKEDHYDYGKEIRMVFYFSLYVHDIFLVVDNLEMKELREAGYVLEVRIIKNRSKKLFNLSQQNYVQDSWVFPKNDSEPIDSLIKTKPS